MGIEWRTSAVTDEREENRRREADRRTGEEKGKRRRDDDGVDTEGRMRKKDERRDVE